MSSSSNKAVACCSGPGYKTPLEAMKAPVETILYIPVVDPTRTTPDYLATIDIDPTSPTYLQAISRVATIGNGNELHHTGWNVCSSCVGSPLVRNKLIMPSLNSDWIFIVDTTNPRAPYLYKSIPASAVNALGVSSPHTPHCMPGGYVMISTMGKPQDGSAQGSFIILDANNDFAVVQSDGWYHDRAPFGYDFWFQFKCDTLITSQWGPPNLFKAGFQLLQATTQYGTSIVIWKLSTKKIQYSIPLVGGFLPLETRFLHNPDKAEGFVACALGVASCKIYHFYINFLGLWQADPVINILLKVVSGWWVEGLPDMPAVITDMLISLDDKYLFVSCWVHGDLRMYDISDPRYPILKSKVWIGGSIVAGGPVTVLVDPDFNVPTQPPPCVVKGRTVTGGPQMIQLSADGTRLYVTTSLYSVWDKQFYPDLATTGSCLLQINVNPVAGTMAINPNFLYDFGNEPGGPKLAHEVRYPGGDCTSDIFLPCP